jgi:hypothetical protein
MEEESCNIQIPTPPNTEQRTRRFIEGLKARVAADISSSEGDSPKRDRMDDSSEDDELFIPQFKK